MKLNRKQLRKLIFEATPAVGDSTFSGQYFDLQYRGKARGKGIYILLHRPTGTVIPTSMYDYSSAGAKRLLKALEKQFGPMLGDPELHLNFDSLSMIYDYLKNWQYPASEYHEYPQ
tara:strand:- start:1431 stop:1778 length:348 start_codon:yes stop_codon:yes gene_type:complete